MTLVQIELSLKSLAGEVVVNDDGSTTLSVSPTDNLRFETEAEYLEWKKRQPPGSLKGK